MLLPFHQDERLSQHNLVLQPEDASVVEPVLPDADRWQRLVTLYDQLAARVAAATAEAGITTVVSGDCLAALGTLAGMQRAGLDPSLVWFDAHGDVHTAATSTSGYLGGMALRMALGGDAERLACPLGLQPLAEERVVLVDGRDLDPAEVAYLATADVQRRRVEDVEAEDLPNGPLLLHLDVDVIDAASVPGVRFPVAGGPSKDAVLSALRRLIRSGRVRGVDVACIWSDAHDEGEQRVRHDLLAELLYDVTVVA